MQEVRAHIGHLNCERLCRILWVRVFDDLGYRQHAVTAATHVRHRVVDVHPAHQPDKLHSARRVGEHGPVVVSMAAWEIAIHQRVFKPLEQRTPSVFKDIVANRLVPLVDDDVRD